MSDVLEIQEVRSLDALEKMRERWSRLIREAPLATPFQTWEWNFWLASSEQDRIRLRVLALERGSRLVGIAPFCIRAGAGRWASTLELIGGRVSDYLDLIHAEEDADEVAGAVRKWIERSEGWRVLVLRNLRRRSLEAMGAPATPARPTEICPRAALPDSVDAYERSQRGRLRSILDRKGRPLAREGRIEFSVSGPDDVDHDLAVLFALHQRRQVSLGRRGRFRDERLRERFRNLARDLLRAGMLELGTVTIDGRPAGAVLNLRLGDTEYFYQGGFEPELARHSPGTLLHDFMIRRAIRDGIRFYDFLQGEEAYKYWWADRAVEVFDLTRARSRADAIVWQSRESLRRTLHESRFVRRVYWATAGRKALKSETS